MKPIDRMIMNSIAERFRNGKGRLILLDYDGTLVEYKSKPDNATPTRELNDLLGRLASDPRNTMYLITGRGYRDIDSLFPASRFNLIADHGAMIRSDGEWSSLLETDNSWKPYVRTMIEDIGLHCPGSFLEEKEFSLAWHYRNTGEERGHLYSRKLIGDISSGSRTRKLKIIDGNKVVEITSTGVSKGNAVNHLLSGSKYEFIFCAGDDRTDEDMFYFLRKYEQAVTVKVGDGDSLAGYRVETPEVLLSLLGRIL